MRAAGGIETSALYTFGSPRVGDSTFRGYGSYRTEPNLHAGIPVFPFVNSNDLVARVPDSGYVHACVGGAEVDGLIYLPTAGRIDVGGKSSEFLSDPERARVLNSLGDRSIDLYAKRLLSYAGRVAPPPALSPRRG